MSPENIARIDAYCAQVAQLARALEVLAVELEDMRDELRGRLADPRQIPMPVKEAA